MTSAVTVSHTAATLMALSNIRKTRHYKLCKKVKVGRTCVFLLQILKYSETDTQIRWPF